MKSSCFSGYVPGTLNGLIDKLTNAILRLVGKGQASTDFAVKEICHQSGDYVAIRLLIAKQSLPSSVEAAYCPTLNQRKGYSPGIACCVMVNSQRSILSPAGNLPDEHTQSWPALLAKFRDNTDPHSHHVKLSCNATNGADLPSRKRPVKVFEQLAHLSFSQIAGPGQLILVSLVSLNHQDYPQCQRKNRE